MSILGFLFKSKKEMAKKNTKRVKVGKYTITKHAQNRIVEESRKIDKIDVLENLFTKPNGITKVKCDELGQPSYYRVGKRATTGINPTNNNVVTCRPVSMQDRRDFNLVNISKKGQKKYVKRKTTKYIYSESKRSCAKTIKKIKYC